MGTPYHLEKTETLNGGGGGGVLVYVKEGIPENWKDRNTNGGGGG